VKPIEAFPALSHRLLLFGFNPVDLGIILAVFTFLHVVFDSLILDAVAMLPMLYGARRWARRPAGYLASLKGFLMTPDVLAVRGDGDGASYRNRVDGEAMG